MARLALDRTRLKWILKTLKVKLIAESECALAERQGLRKATLDDKV